MACNISYKPFGERSILITWKPVIEQAVLKDVIAFKGAIEQAKSDKIIEVRSAYNSILIVYREALFTFEKELLWLQNIYKTNANLKLLQSVLWRVPVCYDAVFGVDLEVVARENNISKEDIIDKHTQTVYSVYFIGFLPGFLYLGGLDERLFTPRKHTPRLKVEKGAVAIGGNQTGVYPNESPGGWNIIGNSPVSFFNIEQDSPCFAKAGDYIQFYPISLKTHQEIKVLVDSNRFNLESEVVDD